MDALEIDKLTSMEDRNWWYKERRYLIGRELERLGEPGVALDIGAAGGGNTRVLRDAGWRAIAVEYGEEGALMSARRKVSTVRGDGTALPFADSSADLVVAFDVLEHIVDDHAAVSEIARTLRTDGTLLIAVPADMALWSAHDEAVSHVRRYSRDSLTSLVRAAGLTVETVRSWNVLLRPVVKMHRANATESDCNEVAWPLNVGLGAVVKAERYLPLGSRRGVSLMLRARKAGPV